MAWLHAVGLTVFFRVTVPADGYALIIHCGGCMLNEREVRYRMKCAADQQVPITNYGIAIAYMQGILKRSIGIFPHLLLEFEE